MGGVGGWVLRWGGGFEGVEEVGGGWVGGERVTGQRQQLAPCPCPAAAEIALIRPRTYKAQKPAAQRPKTPQKSRPRAPGAPQRPGARPRPPEKRAPARACGWSVAAACACPAPAAAESALLRPRTTNARKPAARRPKSDQKTALKSPRRAAPAQRPRPPKNTHRRERVAGERQRLARVLVQQRLERLLLALHHVVAVAVVRGDQEAAVDLVNHLEQLPHALVHNRARADRRLRRGGSRAGLRRGGAWGRGGRS